MKKPTEPTEPGYWWRTNGSTDPATWFVVEVFRNKQDKLQYICVGETDEWAVDQWGWLCPCLTPAEQGQRLMELLTQKQTLLAVEKTHYRQGDSCGLSREIDAIRESAAALGITLP